MTFQMQCTFLLFWINFETIFGTQVGGMWERTLNKNLSYLTIKRKPKKLFERAARIQMGNLGRPRFSARKKEPLTLWRTLKHKDRHILSAKAFWQTLQHFEPGSLTQNFVQAHSRLHNILCSPTPPGKILLRPTPSLHTKLCAAIPL